MSTNYILDCAKQFEELYTQVNERLEIFSSQNDKSEELTRLKGALADMENVLNTIELENSLMSGTSGPSNESNIAKTCRSHYNDIRRRFGKLESGALIRIFRQSGKKTPAPTEKPSLDT